MNIVIIRRSPVSYVTLGWSSCFVDALIQILTSFWATEYDQVHGRPLDKDGYLDIYLWVAGGMEAEGREA